MKTKLYFDMDGTLVDFLSGVAKVDTSLVSAYEGHYDDIPEVFSKMEPMPGALDAVRALAEKYDCWILTTAPWKNPSAWGDKIAWVTKYFDDIFHKKVIMTHAKDLLNDGASFLIDDRTAHGADSFGDRLILFHSDRFPDWESVKDYLAK